MSDKQNLCFYGDGNGKAVKTIRAFIDCMDGNDLTRPVSSKVFAEKLLGRDVNQNQLRALFNAFHW